MRHLRVFSVVAFLFVVIPSAWAQLGVSPNSRQGLGEVMDKGNVRSMGMGGVGLSSGSPLYANVMNPALLIHNPYVIFEASLLGERKTLENPSQKIDDMGANLLNLHFAFPIVRTKYTMGLGLRPYSLVNYKFTREDLIPNTQTFSQATQEGSGGISQAYWAHGVRVAKGVSLGMELIYNFGSIQDEEIFIPIDPTNAPVDGLDFVSRTTFADFSFTPGIVISKKLDSAVYVNFGATYERKLDIKADFSTELERITRGGNPVSIDSLTERTARIQIPSILNFGLSIEKTQKYLFGVDFSWQKWGEYQNSVNPDKLSDAWRLSVGGEWIPDATSVSNYFKRVTYRTGLRYYNTPWMESTAAVNDVQIRDIGINFGLSLPINRGLSNLNLAFTVGDRGNKAAGVLKERYYRVGVGININDPQWFRRRKFN